MKTLQTRLEDLVSEFKCVLATNVLNSGDLDQLEEDFKDLYNEDYLINNQEVDQERHDMIDLECSTYLDLIEEINELLNSYDNLIAEDNIDEYLEDLARDAYSNDLENLPEILSSNIDWEQVTKEMKYDYSISTFKIEFSEYDFYYHS